MTFTPSPCHLVRLIRKGKLLGGPPPVEEDKRAALRHVAYAERAELRQVGYRTTAPGQEDGLCAFWPNAWDAQYFLTCCRVDFYRFMF